MIVRIQEITERSAETETFDVHIRADGQAAISGTTINGDTITVPTINHPFRGFPGAAQGKRDTFDGIAKIAPVGPDYNRSIESWVIMDVEASGVKHGLSLPDGQWSELALWIKRDTPSCKTIDAMLAQKLRSRAA